MEKAGWETVDVKSSPPEKAGVQDRWRGWPNSEVASNTPWEGEGRAGHPSFPHAGRRAGLVAGSGGRSGRKTSVFFCAVGSEVSGLLGEGWAVGGVVKVCGEEKGLK